MLIQGIPAVGEESDTDSFDKPEPEDSGDEWDKTECTATGCMLFFSTSGQRPHMGRGY